MRGSPPDRATLDAFVAHARSLPRTPLPAVANVRQYVVNGRVELPETVAYCGRRNAYYRLPASPWANPFRGADAVERFEAYARERLARDPGWIVPLAGKSALACWCSPPAAPEDCHCSVLVALLRERHPYG